MIEVLDHVTIYFWFKINFVDSGIYRRSSPDNMHGYACGFAG